MSGGAEPPAGAPDPVFAAFCAARLWPGLGRTTVVELAAAGVTGPETVAESRLVSVAGVSARRAARLARSWSEAAPAFAVARLLAAAGLPVAPAAAVVAAHGERAAQLLAEDPWLLLQVPGVLPREADVLALRTLAVRPGKDDPRRGRAFTRFVLERAAADGHTVQPEELVAAALAGLDVPDPSAATAAAVAGGAVVACPGGWALARYDAAERAVARGVARLLRSARPLAGEQDAARAARGLDPAQHRAVDVAAREGVSLLTGGPGTGKSRTVSAVVALAGSAGRRVVLAAPTGRAAKRLEELADAPAATVHRMLGAQGTSGEYARGPDWPLDADVVVVDETSMLDVELAAALLDACADGVHLVLVGDPAQLPSIGPGRVLGDLIDSGAVTVTELTTLHRQAEGGAIARLAAAVREGELPPVDSPDREVVVVPAAGSDVAARRVVQLVTDSIPRALGIDAAEVQVVTPVHRGPAGTVALNVALKARLNPGDGTVSGFDVGDRVVATANHLDDGFANGEVGTVSAIRDGQLQVTFADVAVSIPPRAVGDLRHGWAVTVHRAQGSEWPAVVAVLPPEAGGMLSRPLVYTAITRARRHLSVVHAAGAAVSRAVRVVGARPRRTRLTGLLHDAVAGTMDPR